MGTPSSYCDECVEHVRAARDRAMEERRALNGRPEAETSNRWKFLR